MQRRTRILFSLVAATLLAMVAPAQSNPFGTEYSGSVVNLPGTGGATLRFDGVAKLVGESGLVVRETLVERGSTMWIEFALTTPTGTFLGQQIDPDALSQLILQGLKVRDASAPDGFRNLIIQPQSIYLYFTVNGEPLPLVDISLNGLRLPGHPLTEGLTVWNFGNSAALTGLLQIGGPDDPGPGSVLRLRDVLQLTLFPWDAELVNGIHIGFAAKVDTGENQPPVANAGQDQTVTAGVGGSAQVTLDGSGSSDPDVGDTLSYDWSLPGGGSVSGVSPTVSLGVGAHNIQLTVNDGKGGSDTDVVVITVQAAPSDATPPTVTSSLTPPANGNGWNNSDVTVAFSGTDAQSPPVTCEPSSTVVSTAGAGQTVTATCTDGAGNSATATATVNLDKTAPTIAANVSPPPNPAGWNNALTSPVSVSFTCSDALSGVVGACGPDQSVSSDTAGTAVTGNVKDNAGNTASASATVKLDTMAPEIAITGCPAADAYLLLGQAASVNVSVSDALSGVASQSHVNGTVALDTSTVGDRSLSVTASDVAGNTINQACAYRVRYNFIGFLSPISNQPTYNVAKAGQGVAMKFRLFDGNGGVISDLAAVTATQVKTAACPEGAPGDPIADDTASKSGLHFDETDQQFVYVWNTPRSLTGKCANFVLGLNDTSMHLASFAFQ